MILKALVDLAHREHLVDDPDFEPKEVRWVIHLGPGGRLLGDPVETEGLADARGKVRPRVMQVPRGTVRTSGSAAMFLVDKAEYVLGFDPDDSPKKRKKLAHHRRLFTALVESALERSPGEPGLVAVRDFLRDGGEVARCVDAVRGRAAANDLFAFRYVEGDEAGLVHDREAVRTAWRAMRQGGARAAAVECLVCGQDAPPARVRPQVKRVPGGTTSGIALVSFNAPAFESLALDGNDNAPVCQACAEAYGTALNRLFHPQYTAPDGTVLGRRSIRLSEDTGVIYWASSEHRIEDEFGGLDYADEAQAQALYDAVHRGAGVTMDDPTPFHALVVTGGQGRATLRGYHQTTVGAAAANLRAYFEDIAMVPRFAEAPRWPPLRWLVRSLAPQGKPENVDADLAGRLFLAVLTGAPFPRAVLHEAVARIRSEREDPNQRRYKHTRERLALIRATLNRRNDPVTESFVDEEIPPMLDPSCASPAYCLGRLFAILEKLQGDAIGSPGASITDRFYGAASATPAAVFGTLLRKAQHHLAKVDGPYYAIQLQQVLDLLSPSNAFPKTLSLEEQGLFALGYYHQRAELWKRKPKADADQPTTAAPAV
jgi:CRISPR-associated protein Csd1